MPSLGQVVQFSRLFTIHCDGCAAARSSLERWLMFARSQHWRCESRGTRQTRHIIMRPTGYHEALNESMCRRVTVCLFIIKSYIQFQSTLQNTTAPRGRAPAVFARQSSGISCSEWFPLSCRSDKMCWQCCLYHYNASIHRPGDSPDVWLGGQDGEGDGHGVGGPQHVLHWGGDQHQYMELMVVTTRASNDGSRRFHNHGEGHYYAFLHVRYYSDTMINRR